MRLMPTDASDSCSMKKVDRRPVEVATAAAAAAVVLYAPLPDAAVG